MADKQALATFLAAVHGVHASGSGTKEASFYTAIDDLLDGIGDTLKPKVAPASGLVQPLLKSSLAPQERLGLEQAMTEAGAAYWRIK